LLVAGEDPHLTSNQQPATSNWSLTMPRIAGVDIPNDKKIKISLRYIFGVGPTNAIAILKEAGIDGERRAKELTEDELAKIIRTLVGCAKSAAIAATVTAAACLSADSVRDRTLVPARDRARPLLVRRA
jgi:ribosomal protein S13